MGVTVRELQPCRYLFRFNHEGDISRIIEDGLWTFEQSLLILRRLEPDEDPKTVVLNHADFRVQLYGLPIIFRSKAVIQATGNFLRTFVKSDERNFDGSMCMFYRVRVALDISRPLRKKMKLKRDNGKWAFIDFHYKCLPTLCFLCGVIGHGDRYYLKVLQAIDVHAEKPYVVWLRAGTRMQALTTGQRWITLEMAAEWRSEDLREQNSRNPEKEILRVIRT